MYSIEQIKELMASMQAYGLHVFFVKNGDFELKLECGSCNSSGKEYFVPKESSQPEREHYAPEAVKTESSLFIVSPMVGTFYAAPGPGMAPFVKVGDVINENTIVGVIEAMKVMNEVKADLSGTIAEILIENGQPIEFGIKMFRIVK